jgi:SAM-dependent methyltransferase
MTRTLDLGCGKTPANPFMAEKVFGIDIEVAHGSKNIFQADLAISKIPFKDNYFDFVTAVDFLEHIPRLLYLRKKRTQPFINLMNEIWRVLKPNGIFQAYTPCFPKDEAFVDPTHVNFISFNTINYFCGDDYLDLSKSYGFNGLFKKLKCEWSTVAEYHLIWELEAKK